MKVFDGAAIVNVATFEKYANVIFTQYIKKNLHTCKLVDAVWDTYIAIEILKSQQEGVEEKEGGK